jgi:hypothetical protein
MLTESSKSANNSVFSCVVMVLVLSALSRRSRCAPMFLAERFFNICSTPMVGDDRRAASLLPALVGDCCLRISVRILPGDGFPGVLSTSVTSPISDSIVPLPYMMGVVGVIGPVGPYGWFGCCWPVPLPKIWFRSGPALCAFFHIIRGE